MEDKIISPELQMLRNNKESGYNYREKRHTEWEENYSLYRDRPVVNRLIQRQSVHVPLMKQTVRTLLKDIDDMPVLYFENLDNDKDAEIFKNEYWKWTVEKNNMELQDLVDKRQVLLFGRSFDQWQIVDGKVVMNVIDPMDIMVSRFMNPYDLHSSRFLIHNHIFVSLGQLEKDDRYDKDAIRRIKAFYKTDDGIIKNATNQQSLIDKNQKMIIMGDTDVDNPIVGETIVELSLHFVFRKENDDEEEQIYLYVECDDMEILMKERLEDVMGETKDHFFRDHFPYVSWAEDLERQDFWCDGPADIVRTPNKILDSDFSQLAENRTLKNFNMHYYNGTKEGFTPQTFQPTAWGWYPVPGDPSEIIKDVVVPDLSESLDEMMFIIQMVEKATGATATQQGQATERKITLGEVQLALGEAKERVKGMSKFYTPAWKQRGEMFAKIVEAGGDKLDAVKVYKKGNITQDIYSREVGPSDWTTPLGYTVKVWSQDEKDAKTTEDLQKIDAVSANMPGNPKLEEIKQRKLLQWVDLTPDEVNEVMEYENMRRQAMLSSPLGMTGASMMAPPQAPPAGQPMM